MAAGGIELLVGTTKAGRRFSACRFVNGKGTATTSNFL
jgi:hypothetical protein